jgi:predicted O-methyltransferase YrrM
MSHEEWICHIFYGPPCPAVTRLDLPHGDYSITPAVAQLLARVITKAGSKSLLEFGAGSSSEVLAAALCEVVGAGRLTSIEHQPEFSTDAWSRVEKSGIDAELIVAPLEECVTSKGKYFSYPAARKRIEERAPYDFVFVDAPPGVFGREGALHEVASYLAPGALVVLDDLVRRSEQQTLHEWLHSYPQARLMVFHPSFSRGIGILRFGAT